MPRPTQGSIYQTRGGYGIRWPENGKREHRNGFRTRTEAREWFDDNVKPRLRHGTPTPDLTLREFAAVYLERWGPTVSPRTVATVRDWLGVPVDASGQGRIRPGSAIDRLGDWPLRDLEGAAAHRPLARPDPIPRPPARRHPRAPPTARSRRPLAVHAPQARPPPVPPARPR